MKNDRKRKWKYTFKNSGREIKKKTVETMNRIVEMKIDVQYEKEVYIKVGGYEWSIFCKYKQKA